jgi:hypothetical protein
MKHKVFFAEDRVLISYLNKYGQMGRSIDHEINISLYAKESWEKKLNKKLMIVFEQNRKMHNYPDRFTATAYELKNIFETYAETNTPVDFALAPISSSEEFDGFAYPFQVKRKPLRISANAEQKLAVFISKKANSYRDTNIVLIIDPQFMGKNKNEKKFKLDELKKMIKIKNDAVRAIYLFQKNKSSFDFLLLWISPHVKE